MGVLDRSIKTELIDGELYDMAADGPIHRDWSDEIGRWLHRHLDETHRIIPSSTLVLSPDNAPMPDWYVYPASVGTREVAGPDVLLLIEQSDSSLSYDLRQKAALYARYGVRDYWVIDLRTSRITVHREPSPDGYGFTKRHQPEDMVEPLLLPGLVLDTSAFRIG
jgi:Uma2 family endonuclease